MTFEAHTFKTAPPNLCSSHQLWLNFNELQLCQKFLSPVRGVERVCSQTGRLIRKPPGSGREEEECEAELCRPLETRRPALERPACSKAAVLLDFLLTWDQFGT